MDKFHISIMSQEIIEALNVQRGAWYVDATLGGGGHAQAIAEAGGKVLGLDIDEDAIRFARMRLKNVDGVILKNRSYTDLRAVLDEEGIASVDGVVFDLGVSSHQFDTPERGFSYRFEDSPLDMRFSRIKKETAEDLLASSSEEELYEIIAAYGEEERARTIAHALTRSRKVKKFEKVSDLNRSLETIAGVGQEHFRMLSRVYQALRMAVNNELESVREGLEQAEKSLSSGGKLVVLTFHSLEDRIVKRFLVSHNFSVLTKKPVVPSRDEKRTNTRSRSAKMRVGIKL